MVKIAFFGSDQNSEIVFQAFKKDLRFEIGKAPPAHLPLKIINKELKAFQPQVGILASYGKILNNETLNIPKHGILNIHPSLLPKYRGPTPVPATILNGDKQTGVTILKMDEQVDHGPIIAQVEQVIEPDETAEALLKRLFTLGAQVLLTILPAYLDGRIKPKRQTHSKATWTKKLTKESGRINWQKSDRYRERFIRAMYPWPGAWSEVEINSNKKRLKIHRAHLNKGKLILDLVQLEGKKPVTFKQFSEGYPSLKLA